MAWIRTRGAVVTLHADVGPDRSGSVHGDRRDPRHRLACVAWFLANGDRVAVDLSDRGVAPTGEAVADPDRFLAAALRRDRRRQVDAAFATVEEAWAPVEVLVANAGITQDTLVLRMSEEACPT